MHTSLSYAAQEPNEKFRFSVGWLRLITRYYWRLSGQCPKAASRWVSTLSLIKENGMHSLKIGQRQRNQHHQLMDGWSQNKDEPKQCRTWGVRKLMNKGGEGRWRDRLEMRADPAGWSVGRSHPLSTSFHCFFHIEMVMAAWSWVGEAVANLSAVWDALSRHTITHNLRLVC